MVACLLVVSLRFAAGMFELLLRRWSRLFYLLWEFALRLELAQLLATWLFMLLLGGLWLECLGFVTLLGKFLFLLGLLQAQFLHLLLSRCGLLWFLLKTGLFGLLLGSLFQLALLVGVGARGFRWMLVRDSAAGFIEWLLLLSDVDPVSKIWLGARLIDLLCGFSNIAGGRGELPAIGFQLFEPVLVKCFFATKFRHELLRLHTPQFTRLAEILGNLRLERLRSLDGDVF